MIFIPWHTSLRYDGSWQCFSDPSVWSPSSNSMNWRATRIAILMWDPEWHQVDIPSILPQKQVFTQNSPSPNPLRTRFFPPCLGHWATCPQPWALWPLRPRTQPENRGRSTQNHRRGKTKRPHSERDSKEIILNQPRSEKIQHQCHLRCLWNLTHPGTPSQEHFAHDLWNNIRSKIPSTHFWLPDLPQQWM